MADHVPSTIDLPDERGSRRESNLYTQLHKLAWRRCRANAHDDDLPPKDERPREPKRVPWDFRRQLQLQAPGFNLLILYAFGPRSFFLLVSP
jgi:hypothetical protein